MVFQMKKSRSRFAWVPQEHYQRCGELNGGAEMDHGECNNLKVKKPWVHVATTSYRQFVKYPSSWISFEGGIITGSSLAALRFFRKCVNQNRRRFYTWYKSVCCLIRSFSRN